jgi:hypothetical protein
LTQTKYNLLIRRLEIVCFAPHSTEIKARILAVGIDLALDTLGIVVVLIPSAEFATERPSILLLIWLF